MTRDAYLDCLERCGSQVDALRWRDRLQSIRRWRERFAAPVADHRGGWRLGGYDWHVFSFGHVPALVGDLAFEEYRAREPGVFLVIPQRDALPAFRAVGGALPDFRSSLEDVAVWPEDLGWTMAFTHEESIGLGPCFCRADWVPVDRGQAPLKRRRRSSRR